MDYVYVIYFDGKLHKNRTRKVAYLEEKYAKQVVTTEVNKLANTLAYEDNKIYYDLSSEEKQEYIDKARDRFEIRRFVEEK
ncbi:hypothetical protein [Clostridium sp.]|uniref:hypothetical protein n=1 Tax=Clostridium sp. TaxID=1506 RepID=UPI002623ED67|nr:hypothetical protein [Clostridium sp.]